MLKTLGSIHPSGFCARNKALTKPEEQPQCLGVKVKARRCPRDLLTATAP